MTTYLPDMMMISEEEVGGGGEVLEEIFLDTPIEGAPLTAGNSSFINDVIKDLDLVSYFGALCYIIITLCVKICIIVEKCCFRLLGNLM